MKMLLTFLLLTIGIAGCASAPAQMYRPRNYDGPAWQIECEQTKLGLWDFSFVIHIDGENVIEGKFADWQNVAEYSGQYKDHKITANFARQYRGSIQIMVFVDGERAATF